MSANDSVSIETIEDFISSRAEYILNALEYYEELEKYSPKPKKYVNGESISILGRERRIKVFEGAKNSVESDMSYIYLTVKDFENYELKKKTFDKWFRSLCKDTIGKACETIYPKFQKYDVSYPEIRYRNMISRWGSCQPKRKILTFNYRLIEAPMFCIEYVAMHEFTHFLFPNHSKQFYQHLSMIMLDWKERKGVLEKTSALKE